MRKSRRVLARASAFPIAHTRPLCVGATTSADACLNRLVDSQSADSPAAALAISLWRAAHRCMTLIGETATVPASRCCDGMVAMVPLSAVADGIPRRP